MEQNTKITETLLHLSRLSLAGRKQDIQLFIKKTAKALRATYPEVAEGLTSLLKEMPSLASPIRSANMESVPVDRDSRLQLLKFENPATLDIEPIWANNIKQELQQVLKERQAEDELLAAGLAPTSSLLFKGCSGVGKTLAARWLATKLNLPLLILDLSAVMSSFLGRTGSNVRNVFDYAKGSKCILLLDEMDAIAKKRDDIAEIGELKRLVTVLLQEIDDWCGGGILIAATNHPEMLDPAVWRRFERIIDFPKPNNKQVEQSINLYLCDSSEKLAPWRELLSIALSDCSYSDIEREITKIRRASIINKEPLEKSIENWLNSNIQDLSKNDRADIAKKMINAGLSQRKASEITGVSRTTLRKVLQ